jgi:A/G-specific adenine glycosylase
MTFQNDILRWYYGNGRKLPWRETKEPYIIWVSEIILQQTRIDQGLPYFQRFVSLFPDIQTFYKASEEQVLKAWEGLGYYSRARNMKQAAKQIVEENKGIFPDTYEDLLKLKGVGPYTAAAIASICFDLSHATVDGNVLRVLSRYFNIPTPIDSSEGKKEFENLANTIIPKNRAGDYNQAVMELGAMICKPVKPKCVECPVCIGCAALRVNKINDLPAKEKKLKRKNRFLNFLYIHDKDSFFIEKREISDIWQGLYQLPMIETYTNKAFLKLSDKEEFKAIICDKNFDFIGIEEVLHKLTHQDLHIKFYIVHAKRIHSSKYKKTPNDNWKDFAFPVPIKRFLEKQIRTEE